MPYSSVTGLPKVNTPNTGDNLIKTSSDQLQVNPFTGSLSYQIPLELTPSRALTPQLALSYSSSAGKSCYGKGFNLFVDEISRSTIHGVTTYNDNEDIFFCGSLGELVRGDVDQNRSNENWQVIIYHPRHKEKFESVEFWQDLKRVTNNEKSKDNKDNSYWLVRGDNGVNHVFGRSDNNEGSDSADKIMNPANPAQIYSWLLKKTYDAKGNKIIYHYKKSINDANCYLSAIEYGNYYKEENNPQTECFAFEVVFDYGNNNYGDEKSPHIPDRNQININEAIRSDSYVSYQTGFAIRTTQICHNILLFHRFNQLFNDTPFLVKRWQLSYQQAKYSGISLLNEVQQIGYKKLSDDQYVAKSLPPIKLDYQELTNEFALKTLELQRDCQNLDQQCASPSDLISFRFVDLYREGLPGILYSDNDSSYYWRNLGDGTFASPQLLGSFPVERNLFSRRHQLMLLPGSDQMAFVVGEACYGGFYGSLGQDGWENYQSFENYPSDFTNPVAELFDINSSGYDDLVIFNNVRAIYYLSLGKQGFAEAKALELPDDFPITRATDNTELITSADILGDGITHRVRITRNKIECWPNLGHGKFGEKIELKDAPDFGEDFDTRRLFLANVSGTGATDLIYVIDEIEESSKELRSKLKIYINQQGNQFGKEQIEIILPEVYTLFDQIRFVDLMGKGTSCVVFTKVGVTNKHYYYDLAPKQKPHILKSINNSFGVTTEINYISSVECYAQDIKDETRQPRYKCSFPVSVVNKVTKTDKVIGKTLINRYRFHDGYYDGQERRFTGFGYVESWEGEEHEAEHKAGDSDTPVKYAKRWYHCGAAEGQLLRRINADEGTAEEIAKAKEEQKRQQSVSQFYQSEYDPNDEQVYLLPDSQLNVGKTDSDKQKEELIRQAYFALQGSLIRLEVYGLDNQQQGQAGDSSNTDLTPYPYMTLENNYVVNSLDVPRVGNTENKGIFIVNTQETITYNYERNPLDPRITHLFNLSWDNANNLLQSCVISYPRRTPANLTAASSSGDEPQLSIYAQACIAGDEKQRVAMVIATRRNLIEKVNSQNKEFQYVGVPTDEHAFAIQLENKIISPTDCSVEKINTLYKEAESKLAETVLQQERYYYWDDALDKPVQFKEQTININIPLLIHHSEKLVESDIFLSNIYKQLGDNLILELQSAGYVNQDKNWWQPGLVQLYAKDKFYLPIEMRSVASIQSNQTPQLWQRIIVEYDPYQLVVLKWQKYLCDKNMSQPQGFTSLTVEIDYHALLPQKITNANETITEVIIDPLGIVIASKHAGKVNNIEMGNKLFGKNNALRESKLKLLMNATILKAINGDENYIEGFSNVLVYDLWTYQRVNKPTCNIILAAEQFEQPLPSLVSIDNLTPQKTPVKMVINYQDGLGDTFQTKLKIDEQAAGKSWLVSSFVVEDNRGLAIKKYLPFFSNTYEVEYESVINTQVTTPTSCYYDALGRQIKIINANGTVKTMMQSAWFKIVYDENDNAKQSPHYDTPTIQLLNAQGKAYLTIEIAADEKGENKTLLRTKAEIDVLGRTLSLQDPRLTKPNMVYSYDKQGRVLKQESVDSGTEVNLYNIYGKVIQRWNSRNYHFRNEYDNWQRIIARYVAGGEGENQLKGIYCVEKIMYGESINAAEKRIAGNLNGQVIEYSDQSGISYFKEYDIQGNCINEQRKLYIRAGEKEALLVPFNWDDPQAQKYQVKDYTRAARFDALGKPLEHKQPDNSVCVYQYNQAMQLKGIVLITPNKQVKPIVEEMTYSATSQYQSIRYGNGMQTNYTFDDKSRRISTLITVDNKKPKSGKLQDVAYYYDEIGNIVKLDDKSYQILFDQPSAQPSASESPTVGTVGSALTTEINPQADKQLSAQQYEYDSLYRVKTATGRELSSTETAAPPAIPAAVQPTNPAVEITPPALSVLSTAGSAAKILASLQGKDPAKELMPYKESFEYDAGSNLTKQQHQPVTANPTSPTPSKAWEKVYQIDEKSNHLKGQVQDNQAEAVDHDSAGNQQNLPGQIKLQWNYLNQLIYAHKKSNEEEIEEYYFYNVAGMRTRKLTKKQLNNVITITEVIYQGYYELRRQLNVNDLSVIKETEIVSLRILDGNRQVATYRYQNNIEGRIIYLLDNHLNSISLEVDEQAEILSYEEYLPYGETSILIGKDQKVLDEKTYHYSVKEKDEATGMYYYGARYYAAGQGRWTATDPAGFVDGLNVYCFVKNNPIVFIDIEGNFVFNNTSLASQYVGVEIIRTMADSETNKLLTIFSTSDRLHLEFNTYTGNYKEFKADEKKMEKNVLGWTSMLKFRLDKSAEWKNLSELDSMKGQDKKYDLSKLELKVEVNLPPEEKQGIPWHYFAEPENIVNYFPDNMRVVLHEFGVHAIIKMLQAIGIYDLILNKKLNYKTIIEKAVNSGKYTILKQEYQHYLHNLSGKVEGRHEIFKQFLNGIITNLNDSSQALYMISDDERVNLFNREKSFIDQLVTSRSNPKDTKLQNELKKFAQDLNSELKKSHTLLIEFFEDVLRDNIHTLKGLINKERNENRLYDAMKKMALDLSYQDQNKKLVDFSYFKLSDKSLITKLLHRTKNIQFETVYEMDVLAVQLYNLAEDKTNFEKPKLTSTFRVRRHSTG